MNNSAIDAAVPGTVLWDDRVKGLHLRCFPKRKVFYLIYRPKRAKGQRRPKIGVYGEIGLARARELAGAMLDEVRAGRDPVADAKVSRAGLTVRQLAALYMRHIRSDPKARKVAKSQREDLRQLKRHIVPRWGRRLARDITRDDVETLHREMSGSPVQANRTRSLLSCMFNLAEVKGVRPEHSNPCRLVRRYTERKRRRHMTGAEAPRIAALLDKHEPHYPRAVLFIYLLILTGARPDEIRRATEGAVADGKLILQEHKTAAETGEPRVIYLPTKVLGLLEACRTMSPAKTLTGIDSPQYLWRKIRAEAGCPDLRLYDLRRTFASAALRAGYTLDQIGQLLGHQSVSTTRGYAWLMDEIRKEAADGTAAVLEDMMRPTMPAAETATTPPLLPAPKPPR